MAGRKVPDTVTERPRRHIHSPKLVSQIGHIDAHRAGCRAKAITGASLLPGVGIFLLKCPQMRKFRSGRIWQRTQGSDFPLRGDPGSGGKCETTGQAINLTETALDALVEFFIDLRKFRLDRFAVISPRLQYRQGLEILQETLRIVIKYHARIKKALRVKQSLDTLHDRERLLAPFVRDKRSHIPSRPVLGLEGAVIFPDHHLGHITDHGFIAVHFLLSIK